ncbi:MAG: metallopeptidase family protein [Actinobacteria bacterium]|nr:metallopeptidase family protein [Actinomycetota bacterium]
MNIEDFENEIIEVLKNLPEKFRSKFENITFIIEENLTKHDRKDLENSGPVYTLGLYQGLPMTMRFSKHPIFPDRITIFKKPLESISRDEEDLKKNIKRVVLHEVGHYFGLGEKRLRELGY